MLLERMANRSLWSSFNQLQTLQDRLNHLFSLEEFTPDRPEYPPVQVWLSEYGAQLKFELAGVSEADVDISVTRELLTLKGKRHQEPLAEGEKLHRQERPHGEFSRTIQLPFLINADEVQAKLDRGVLELTLPRAEADKPKKIKVSSGQ